MRASILRISRGLLPLAVSLVILGVVAGCGGLELGPENQTLLRMGGDVLSAGQEVTLSDSISGDAILAGRTVRFSGVADGSYLGAGGNQEIAGRIAGSARAAGGTVRLQADVGRNVTLAGGNVHIEDQASVAGNAYLAGAAVEVRGPVAGSVRVAGGTVDLDGLVTGDVLVEAGELRVGPRALIQGDLEYRVSEGVATIDPSAQIVGQVRSVPPEPQEGPAGAILFGLFRVLAFLVAGAAVVLLFPTAASFAAHSVRDRPLASLGAGLLFAVLAPIVIAIVALTLIGVPLAVISAVLFGVFVYLAPVVPATWIGERILSRPQGATRLSRATEFLTGGVLIAVATLLPMLGMVVRIVAVLLGFGGATLAIRGARAATQQEA